MRCERAEQLSLAGGLVAAQIEFTAEQVRLIEEANPCFRQRHVESRRTGELLAKDIFHFGTFNGIGKVYLQAVVDSYDSYAFAFLRTTKKAECSVAVLHDEVIPFYADRGITIGAALTDNRWAFGHRSDSQLERGPQTAEGREFCGTKTHPLELYLALNDIERRKVRVRRPQTNGPPASADAGSFGHGCAVFCNGFVERFNCTPLDEFFRTGLRESPIESLETLQAKRDAWLQHDNTERPRRGYRNMDRCPIETINPALQNYQA